MGACQKVLTLLDAQILRAFAFLMNTAIASPEINQSQQSSFLPGVKTGYCCKHSRNMEVSPSHTVSLVEGKQGLAERMGCCLLHRQQDSSTDEPDPVLFTEPIGQFLPRLY